MELDCEGCAGCCIDWRPLAPDAVDHERRTDRPPVDDAYNLVPLTRDEVRDFLDAGLAGALTPRFWHAGDDEGVEIDGIEVAAIRGRPVFFVGIRKPPKPIAPFDQDRTWLPTCTFLDPETLQCRIHDSDLYPAECGDYPGHNLSLNVETECERVEDAFDGERLLDDEPPDDLGTPLFGPQALGAKLFVHPEPDRLAGIIERAAAGELTPEDRAECLGVAAGSSPGMLAVNEDRAAEARETALAASSWVDDAIAEWEERAGDPGDPASDAAGASEIVEVARGAPETPGWE